MSDTTTRNLSENELILKLRAEQGDREKEHHTYTQETHSDTKEIHSDTKEILYITAKTRALITTCACFALVLLAVGIAAGCGVAKATEEEPVSVIALGESNIRRVIERALWLDCNIGYRTAGGSIITDAIVRDEAHRVYEHNQFRWDLPFKHPSYKGWKLEHLRDRCKGVFADELQSIFISE